MSTHDALFGLAGGGLIGLAATFLLVGLGQIAGISGICGDMMMARAQGRGWRVAFLAGLVTPGVLAAVVAPSRIGVPPHGLAIVAGAGLLVGIGTQLGGGCTSGHGVCGLSRLSPRSLCAVATFMIVAAVVVAIDGRLA